MKYKQNNVNITGTVWEQKLEIKTSKAGKEYLSGYVTVATDDAHTNLVRVTYTYVAPHYNNGNVNNSYTILKELMDTNATLMNTEIDPSMAMKVSLSPSLEANEYYSVKREGYGKEDRCTGGFVNKKNELEDEKTYARNTFKVDTVLTRMRMVEENPEKGIDEPYAELIGGIFDYRGNYMPVTFTVRLPQAIAFFEELEIAPNHPVYTWISGRVNAKQEEAQVEAKVDSEAATFTEVYIKPISRFTREFLVLGAKQIPYDIEDPTVMGAEEYNKLLQDYKIRKEEMKADAIAREAAKAQVEQGGGFSIPTNAAPSKKQNFGDYFSASQF